MDVLNTIDYDDFGDVEFVPTARTYRNGDMSAGHGRVASANAHFHLTLATTLRGRQDTARRIERATDTARRRTIRSGRAVKYTPESDGELVAMLLNMPTSD